MRQVLTSCLYVTLGIGVFLYKEKIMTDKIEIELPDKRFMCVKMNGGKAECGRQLKSAARGSRKVQRKDFT